jgi:hypothetical protein
MAFFRSPLLRRIIYIVAFGLALMRFAANRSHSEPLIVDQPTSMASIEQSAPGTISAELWAS